MLSYQGKDMVDERERGPHGEGESGIMILYCNVSLSVGN